MLKTNTAIYQKIAEKRANLERFREFKELTDDLVLQLESIGDKLETMNGGTASVALILANWKSVVQSISLASLASMKESNDNNKEAFPEPLVRVRVGQSNEENQDEEEADEEEGVRDSEEVEESTE